MNVSRSEATEEPREWAERSAEEAKSRNAKDGMSKKIGQGAMGRSSFSILPDLPRGTMKDAGKEKVGYFLGRKE